MRPDPERSSRDWGEGGIATLHGIPSSSSSIMTTLWRKPPHEEEEIVKTSRQELCSPLMSLARKTTIQHWQLRDLVQCPYDGNVVFSVNKNRVVRHDLATLRSSTEMVLNFEPTCFVMSEGYFAAGGQSRQFELNQGDASILRGTTGGSVNNAVRLARDPDRQLRAFVCNNDESIKIHSTENGSVIGLVRCVTAVNHCSIRPVDGSDLICVGDNRHTYLYTARPSGYYPTHIYTEATDAGMSCDWSPSGWLFAAAFQDGLTAVWDIRCQSPIVKFYASSACRNVRFSPAPLDLMAFSEHRGRCHIADSRMWPRQQVVHVGPAPDIEPDIAGFCFSPCGKKLIVGTDEHLMIYEIDTSARRSFAKAEVL